MPDEAPETPAPDAPAADAAPPALAPAAPAQPSPAVDAAPVTDPGALARVDALVASASPATDPIDVTATLAAVAALPPEKRAALAPMADAAEKVAATRARPPAEVPNAGAPPYDPWAGVIDEVRHAGTPYVPEAVRARLRAAEVQPPYVLVGGVRCPIVTDPRGDGCVVVSINVNGATVERAGESLRVALGRIAREFGEVVT